MKSVKLPMLIELRLLSCEGITSASIAAIAYSRLLEVVILSLAQFCKLSDERTKGASLTLVAGATT